MRGLRSFGGLLVVLLALGAYLYFVESKRPAGGDVEKKDKAFAVESDKVEEFTIKSESGEHTTVRKNGSNWEIVQPAAGKPDSAEVSGVTSNLASLEIQRVIDENPADLAEYGLAQPRVEVAFKAAGKDHTLRIGRKTPPWSDLYARIDDQKRVVLIPSFVDTTFNRATFDLRDKAVLSVNRDEIGALTVTTPSSTMRFEKAAGEWKMAQPVVARADFSAIEGLVGRLATLQMKSIAAAQVADPAPYGLDKPVATVTIGSGSLQATLAIGKSSGEGAVYARDLSKPAVVTIEAAVVDDLKKSPGDYRQKDLFDARAFNANRLEVVHAGVTTTFEKVKSKNKDGQEQDTWKQVAPTAKEVDQAKVDDLVSAVTQARAASFVDAAPKGALDTPELAITIASNEGKRQEKVTIGRVGADVFASRAGEPGAAKVDASAADGIVKALGEIEVIAPGSSARRSAVLTALAVASACAGHTAPATPPPSSRAPAAAVRQLRSDLADVFGAAVAARGVWGVEVRSLDTGERLFERDAGKLMMPASNLKILTLAAAAETLGWDYRYTTTLETAGTLENGVLHGDLVVRGTGDPTINSRSDRAAHVLDEWLAALAAAGIRQIDGRIVGDDQAFDDEGIGAGWAWDYLQYGYAAPVGALEYNEDVAGLAVAPGAAVGAPAVVRLDAGSGLMVLNRATTAAAGTDVTLDYRRHLEQPLLEVTGTVPAGGNAVVRAVAVVNPTLFFAQSLKDALVSRGIGVSGPAVDFDDVAAEVAHAEGTGSPRVIATTMSPPLREIAVVLMKVSQNLYAETLLKTVGAARGGLGTVAAGQNVVRSVLTSWGVPADSYVAVDGSGLSRYNYVTADTLTAVLEHMYRDPRHRDALLATLPIAGKDGTMSARLHRTRAEGNALAKTGSISNVRGLSGFVRTRDGEMLVFSILANDFVIPSATINWIADLGVEILSNFTRK